MATDFRPGTIVQGTVIAVAVDPDGPLSGVMLMGKSGVGKSDLAARAIDACPWRRTRLVADDAVILSASDDQIFASCPEKIKGLLELRGVGILNQPSVDAVRLRLICKLGERPRRLPEVTMVKPLAHEEVFVEEALLQGEEASAPLKIVRLLRENITRHFGNARQDGCSRKKRHE